MAKKFRRDRLSMAMWGYVFVLPAIVIITLFWILPSAESIYYGFFHYNGLNRPHFIGFRNYISYFTDPVGLISLRVTGLYIVGTLPAAIVLGLGLAIIINKKWFKGAGLVNTIYFIPVVMSYIGVSFIWKWLLNPVGGLVDISVRFLGFKQILWLETPSLAVFSILFISVWKNLGFFIVLYLSALRQIPTDYLESADLEGVNEIQRIGYIIWPLVLPTTIFLTILSAIDAFQVFDQVYALTGGGPQLSTNIIAFYIYRVGLVELRMGYASAVATIVLIVMVVVTFLQWRYYTSRMEFVEQ